MEEIRFSIIMPAHNAEKEIEDAIKSVIMQDYENYEFIIIDDLSTDNTFEIAKKYEKDNKKIKVIRHNVNKKAGGARNTGIKAADGDYILFLDSDDLLADKDVLKRLNNTIGNDKVDIVYLGFESVGEAIQGKFIPTAENSVKENRISTWRYENVWDVLWNREFILKNNIEFVEGKFFEDFVFYYKGVLKSNSYKYTDYISIIYNSGRKDSMSTAISPTKLKDLYYNMICLLDVLEEVEPKYKTYIVDALKRNNDYINKLLEKLR